MQEYTPEMVMVEHTFNSSTRQADEGISLVQDSQSYMGRSHPKIKKNIYKILIMGYP